MSPFRRSPDRPVFELRGKTALITGAARGIGYETARGLHARGAQVALVDLDREAAEAAAAAIEAEGRSGGPAAIGLAADVTKAADLEAAVAATVERFGGIDVAVANAGVANQAATVNSIGTEAFERVVEVNLLGVWRTVRAVLPQITERGGHLALISSVYAFNNGMLVSPYAVSKAGVEQLGRTLRVELAGHGASATVAHYGFVDTVMVQQGFDRETETRELTDLIRGPLGRRISPAEAADALVRGIEQRKPRVIEPPAWRAVFALRGLLGPLTDEFLRRNRRVQTRLAELERADRSALPELTVPAGSEAAADRPTG